MQTTITTIEEIERVNLRFMRVADDGKLSAVLDKILPSLVAIYSETDLVNAKIDHPKVLKLDELMDHLVTRVENSRGTVFVPVAKLIKLYASPDYI